MCRACTHSCTWWHASAGRICCFVLATTVAPVFNTLKATRLSPFLNPRFNRKNELQRSRTLSLDARLSADLAVLPSRRSTSQRTPRDYTPRILRQTLPFSPPCPAVGIAPTSDVPPLPALKFIATSSLRCTIEHIAACFGVTTPSRKVCQDTFNELAPRTCLTPSKFSPVSSTTSNPACGKRIYKSTYSHHRNPRAPLPPLPPPAPTQPS